MAVVDMQTDQTTEIERLRADCDAWRDASMRAHIIIQRFALEREHLVDAQDALRQKLEELTTEAHSGGASETVVSGLAELLGLVREIAVRNCPIDELARRRDEEPQGSVARDFRSHSEGANGAARRSA